MSGNPLIVVLNMIDEADRLGLNIKLDELRLRLQVPVV